MASRVHAGTAEIRVLVNDEWLTIPTFTARLPTPPPAKVRLGAASLSSIHNARCPECDSRIPLEPCILGKWIATHNALPGEQCRGSHLLVLDSTPICEGCSCAFFDPNLYCFMDRCCIGCDDTNTVRPRGPDDAPCAEGVAKLARWRVR